MDASCSPFAFRHSVNNFAAAVGAVAAGENLRKVCLARFGVVDDDAAFILRPIAADPHGDQQAIRASEMLDKLPGASADPTKSP